MEWSLTDAIWNYHYMIKLFVLIFLFAMFWLYFYFHHHYLLLVKLRKHIKFFRKLRTAKTPVNEIVSVIDKKLNKTKDPQIKNLYRALSALASSPVTAGEHPALKHKREIDYFLARRGLQIKMLV